MVKKNKEVKNMTIEEHIRKLLNKFVSRIFHLSFVGVCVYMAIRIGVSAILILSDVVNVFDKLTIDTQAILLVVLIIVLFKIAISFLVSAGRFWEDVPPIKLKKELF